MRRWCKGSISDPDYKVRLPDRFNVAVPFIDRHLGEGRGAKAAIRTAHGETVTYAELAERVNRAGNALLALGLKPGDRLLMVVKDCPAFFYLFWGAIKAGIVPVPLNTLLRAAGLRLHDRGFGLQARRLFDRVRGRGRAGAEAGRRVKALTVDAFLAEMAKASPKLEPRLAAPTDDCFWLYSSGSTGRPKGAVHRHRDMVVTSELYGVRVLGVARGRHLLLGRQALLRLRPGQRHDLPAVDRRHRRARRPPADARHDLRDHRAASSRRSTTACRRSTPRCSWRSTPRRAISPACAPASRPARRCRPTSSAAGRRRPAR